MEQKNNMTHVPKEITIKDWEHFWEFCNELQGCRLDHNDTVIFRGCRDAGWELIPSLYWKLNTLQIDSQRIHEIEREFIDRFKQKWFFDEMTYYIEHTSLFRILYIMQHYGIKTRMLDWTLSWKVAAYFATDNNVDSNDKDAAVWCINKTQIENRFQDVCKEYTERSQYQVKRVEANTCWDVTNQSNCPARQPYNDQIRCNAIFFKDILSSSTDVRMMIQASHFSYCPNPLANHIECITKVLGGDTDKYCTKMIIPAALKPKFRKELKQSGYTHEKLFPVVVDKWFDETFKGIMSKYQNK